MREMKIHAIRSTKLLAITAVTALASGCAATTSPTHAIAPEPSPPLVVTADAPRVAAVSPGAADTRSAANPTAARTPTPLAVAHVTETPEPLRAAPLDDEHAGQRLLELRDELFRSGGYEASHVEARFRPLCDVQGYPVVGNVLRKASGYQPSAYCTNVRASHSKTR